MLRIATLALIASPAVAGDTYSWGSMFYGSTITLQPTQTPGAVAEVVFANETVHADEVVTFTLDLDGLAVEVTAVVGRGLTPDEMTVVAPEGYLAVPPEISVAEGEVGVILVVPFLGY